jgi:addiction module RelE/StbE family toxin
VKVFWSPRAAADLNDLVRFISADKPDAATQVGDRIYQHVEGLASTPHIGRPGILPGTRELIFAPWPYIAIYKIVGEKVRIIRIRHASRQRS